MNAPKIHREFGKRGLAAAPQGCVGLEAGQQHGEAVPRIWDVLICCRTSAAQKGGAQGIWTFR